MQRKHALLTRLFLFLLFIGGGTSISQGESLYTVKKGDSLYTIAKKFKIKIDELKESNQLVDSKIKPGQRLIIPELLGNDQTSGTEKKREKIKTGQVLNLRQVYRGDIKGREDKDDEEKKVNGLGFLITERDRELLVRVAKSFLGLRYRRGGASINGLDCSAFVQRVFKVFGIELPRTTQEQFRVGHAVSRNNLRYGDLVFFKRGRVNRPAHVGIYIGNDKFIHTSLKKGTVIIDNLQKRYFASNFVGARRIEEKIEKEKEENIIHVHIGNPWE